MGERTDDMPLKRESKTWKLQPRKVKKHEP